MLGGKFARRARGIEFHAQGSRSGVFVDRELLSSLPDRLDSSGSPYRHTARRLSSVSYAV